MILEVLDDELTVCKVENFSQVDIDDSPCFIASLEDERSLVCRTSSVPGNTTDREDGWRAMRVSGTLDFGLVGIISKISSVLADAGVPVFIVSTFDTDYILVRSGVLDRAASALESAGYVLRRSKDTVLSSSSHFQWA